MKSFGLSLLCLLPVVLASHDDSALGTRSHKKGWIKKRAFFGDKRSDPVTTALAPTVSNATLLALNSTASNWTSATNLTSTYTNSTVNSTASALPVYNGTALWFIEDGSPGACLTVHTDEDFVVGLSNQLWNDTGALSPLCGQYLQLTNPSTGDTVTALIADASGNQYITLTKAAFSALSPLHIGMINVDFVFLNATVPVTPDTPLVGVAVVPSSSSASSSKDAAVVTDSSSTKASATPVPVAKTTTTTTTDAPKTTTTTTKDTASITSASIASARLAANVDAASASSISAAQAASDASAASQSSASKASASASEASASQASASAQASRQAASQQAAQELSASAASASRASVSWASAQAQSSSDAQRTAQASASAASAAAASSASKASADAAWAASSAASVASAASSRAASKAAAAAAPTSNSGGGSGQKYTNGWATYFTQNGVAGACGTVHQDGGKGIAMDSRMYANGANCGRSITLTRTDNGASVTAVVWDECPTCETSTSLDLSEGAFFAIATEAEGMVPITWQFDN